MVPSVPTGDAVEEDMFLSFDVEKRRRRSRKRGPNLLSSFAGGLPLPGLVAEVSNRVLRIVYIRPVEGLGCRMI